VADHQDLAAALRRVDRALGVLDRVSQRLLDQAVLAGVQDPLREWAVGGDRRGEDDRVERVVAEQVIDVGGEAGGLERRRPAGAGLLGRVAAPRELAARDRGEVAREVRAPIAEADDADASQVNSPHMHG
jgi:hypothetical protein